MTNYSLFFLFFFSVLFSQKTIIVSKNAYYKKIKTAIEAASSNDTIRVKAGRYAEHNIQIRKALCLIAEGLVIIDGEEKDEIITILSDSVTIDGFQIENVAISHLKDKAAIRVKKKKYFKIINNVLHNTFFGIYLEHASDGIVSNNTVIGNAKYEMNSGNAIHLWYSKRVSITKNRVEQHRDGIYFEFVSDSYIAENISQNNIRYGLHFMFSNKNEYTANRFSKNGAGVAVMFSKFITMHHNRFEDNWGSSSYGLLLKEIYDAEIYENVFLSNTIGIKIETSTRINYKHNDFIQNGWAIRITGGCYKNAFTYNNFISNSFEFSAFVNFKENRIDHNYWSDANNYDLNHDNIADLPYRPVKLYSYVVNKTPESIVLIRSFFVDILNFAEKVSPVFTPVEVIDRNPHMKRISW